MTYRQTLLYILSAMNKQDIGVRFQPIVSTFQNQTIWSYEALMWWPDAIDKGYHTEQIIELIEAHQLTFDFDLYIFECVLKQLTHWQLTGQSTPRISINLCPDSIANSNFIPAAHRLLAQYANIQPQWLSFELTERVSWRNYQIMQHNLTAVKNLGIRIGIDDFMTGYANFSTLIDDTVDYLKIDRSVIAQIENSENTRIFLSGFLELAKRLGKAVVAEGVENNQQFNFLQQCGYRKYQGYYFAKPLLADEVWEFTHFWDQQDHDLSLLNQVHLHSNVMQGYLN
ncbi:EAL domain-containing protein [Idiomarina xiamenensis]|uniref:Signaling protein n=1 Tax=Idiomarina xiamenensis 10-D-4 TaxID=740709 RepID=K2K5P0_9GAMM|nr:EAL domain-containing protein [Idiomarina xiamenensis]EKE82928.1 signaling protein [Idiomarina xiamenensis 10-D-4]